MFFRNGEALGSVLHSAVPGANPPKPEATKPEPVPPPAPEPTPVVEAETEPETVAELPVPKHYDTKPEWVDFAVSNGLDRDEAEVLTKAELIELYGGEQ